MDGGEVGCGCLLDYVAGGEDLEDFLCAGYVDAVREGVEIQHIVPGSVVENMQGIRMIRIIMMTSLILSQKPLENS